MIVVAFAPILFLAVVDDISDNLTFVTTSPAASGVRKIEDASLEFIMRFGISNYLAIVPLEILNFIVPMYWHGQGISDKKSEKCALFPLFNR